MANSGWLLFFLALERYMVDSMVKGFFLEFSLANMKDFSSKNIYSKKKKRKICVLLSLCSASAIFCCSLELTASGFINLMIHLSKTLLALYSV